MDRRAKKTYGLDNRNVADCNRGMASYHQGQVECRIGAMALDDDKRRHRNGSDDDRKESWVYDDNNGLKLLAVHPTRHERSARGRSSATESASIAGVDMGDVCDAVEVQVVVDWVLYRTLMPHPPSQSGGDGAGNAITHWSKVAMVAAEPAVGTGRLKIKSS